MSLKSQSATEFIVLASFMFLVILGFFAVTSSKALEAREEGNRKIAEDIAELAYREIETAKSVNDGYTRNFAMPTTVNGIDYSINIIDNRELVVNYLGYEYIKFLPSNVTGNISSGINQIKKINGLISITYMQPFCGNNFCEAGESCSSCSPDCGTCPTFRSLLMRNSVFNVLSFNINGNAVLRGTLQQNRPNIPTTGNDEFVFKDRNGNNIAVVNLNTGNMFIRGSLQQNQQTLSPSPSSDDFIVKDSSGNVISYIDESGNFLLRGTLTQNGNP